MERTSTLSPLEIAEVPCGRGLIGMTICPGKQGASHYGAPWRRDLQADLDRIAAWGARVVVTLMEDRELLDLLVPGLGDAVERRGMLWRHLPVKDLGAPDARFERRYECTGKLLRETLASGGRVLIHCRGGLGRTGQIVARLLVEFGQSPRDAIRTVRAVRPGAIENAVQEAWVMNLSPMRGAAMCRERGAGASKRLPRSPEMEDRAMGAFIGLAVGDALGTTLEFSARDSRPPHRDMVGGGPFKLAPGVWTDDTQMALALAESLIARRGLDEEDLMDRFLRWLRHGAYSPTGICFDCGLTTQAAIARFERTGHPIAGDVDFTSAGNGCLMRLSPVAIYYLDDVAAAADAARRQASTTHGATECLDASEFFARLLARAIQGEPVETLLAPSPWPRGGKVAEIAAGSWRSKLRAEISSSGYVIHSLEAALWAVGGARDFEDALVRAVNLGDDADTVGAITGQLAGAIWGLSAIPERWLAPLAWRGRLEQAGRALIEA